MTSNKIGIILSISVLTLLTTCRPWVTVKEEDKILHAGPVNSGFGVIYFALYKDNKYQFCDGDFMDLGCYTGDYSLAGDTITLYDLKRHRGIPTNRFIIRRYDEMDSSYWRWKYSDTMSNWEVLRYGDLARGSSGDIFPLNSKGKIVFDRNNYWLIRLDKMKGDEDKPKKVDIAKAAYKTLNVKGSPDFLAADGDDVWVINIDTIEKLSATSTKAIVTVPVPGACGALTVSFNSVWVASCRKNSVYRIDNKTGKLLAAIPCGISDAQGEISLASGDSSVWILSDSSGVLTRIDPRSNRIQAKIPVMANSYCAAYGYKSVWITNTNNNSVQRIDPKTNRVIATIKVGNTPRFLAAGEDGVWTLNQKDGTVSRIDPKLNKEVAVIDAGVQGTGGDIATGGRFVWVRAKTRLLQKIDSRSNEIVTICYPVAGSGAVKVAGDYIWVTAHDIQTIWVLKR